MEIFENYSIGMIIFAALGLVFGSFATLASHRIPLRDNIIYKSSMCPICKHRLKAFDLIPLFSWLFYRGKCKYCHSKIHFRYPLTELSLAILFVLIYLKTGISLETLSLLGLAVCLVIIVIIDFEHKIIPDSMQISLIPFGILYWYSKEYPFYLLISGPILGLAFSYGLRYIFFIWKKKEGLGMGDVKFFTVAGLYLGLKAFTPFLLFSGLIGIITAMIWKLLGKGEEYPFGPSLAVSLFLCSLYPEYVVDIFYINYF